MKEWVEMFWQFYKVESINASAKLKGQALLCYPFLGMVFDFFQFCVRRKHV